MYDQTEYPSDSFVPIGAVLVIERRHCLGTRIDENGQKTPCGSVRDAPARHVAQLYLTPYNRRDYSISAHEHGINIDGKNRVIRVQETYCEHCELCFRPNVEWDTLLQIELEKPRTDTAIHTEEEYSAAVAKRDQLFNKLQEVKVAQKNMQAQRDLLEGEHREAIEAVRNFARVHQYNRYIKSWGLDVTKMRKLDIKKPERTKETATPLADDEI